MNISIYTEPSEIFENGFYRAPGGVAYLKFPDMKNREEWKISLGTGKNGFRLLQYTLSGKTGGWRAYASFMFSIIYVSDDDTVKGLSGFLQQVKKDAPYLRESGNVSVQNLQDNTLVLFSQHLEGTGAGKVKELCDIAVATDRTYAVVIIARGNEKDFKILLRQVVTPALGSLKIGKTTAWLRDQHTPKYLEGVWLGPYLKGETAAAPGLQFWLVFDKRGFVTDQAPDMLSVIDFDAGFQEKGQSARIGTYIIDKETIRIKWFDGKSAQYPVRTKENRLSVDNRWYDRVDGKSGGKKLNGTWTSSGNPGSGFWYQDTINYRFFRTCFFTGDGKFSFENAAHAGLADVSGIKSVLSVGNVIGKKYSTRGIYRIENDLLWLFFEDGESVCRTFYPGIQGKTAGDNIVFISGMNFIKK